MFRQRCALNILPLQTQHNILIVGVPVITPTRLWSLEDLIHAAIFETPVQLLPHHETVLAQITDSAVSGTFPSSSTQGVSVSRPKISSTPSGREAVDWANAPDVVSRRAIRQTRQSSSNVGGWYQGKLQSLPSMPGMEVDDCNLVSKVPTPPVRDPRDDLQEQLETALVSILPSLMERSIAAHNQPSDVSMHAYSTPQWGRSRPSRRPLPTSSTEWKAWPPHECVLFLADYPPPPSLAVGAAPVSKQSSTSPPPPFPEETRSALQYLASIIRKNRKGREFGRGDWERASTGLGALWPPVEEAIAQAVRDVFDDCSTSK